MFALNPGSTAIRCCFNGGMGERKKKKGDEVRQWCHSVSRPPRCILGCHWLGSSWHSEWQESPLGSTHLESFHDMEMESVHGMARLVFFGRGMREAGSLGVAISVRQACAHLRRHLALLEGGVVELPGDGNHNHLVCSLSLPIPSLGFTHAPAQESM
jgi:hypothetical protein